MDKLTSSAGGIIVNLSYDAFGKRRGSNWTGSPSSGDWTAINANTHRGYTDHEQLDNRHRRGGRRRTCPSIVFDSRR